MSPALQAHLRLLAQLPSRTVRPLDDRRRNAITAELVQRMRYMEARGFSRPKIAKALTVSETSITNHLGVKRPSSKTLRDGGSGKRGFPVVAESCAAGEAVRHPTFKFSAAGGADRQAADSARVVAVDRFSPLNTEDAR